MLKIFVEAGAGTGKTYALEQFIVERVKEDAGSFDPSKLVVITFTKTIAEELQGRIRRALEKKQVELSSQEELTAKEERRVFLQAIDSFHKATVATVHLFFYRLLSSWDEETGEKAKTFLTDFEKTEWMREFLEEGLQGVLSPWEWEIIARFSRRDEERLLRSLLDIQGNGVLYQEGKKKLEKALSSFRMEYPQDPLASLFEQEALKFKGNTSRDGMLKKEAEEICGALSLLFSDIDKGLELLAGKDLSIYQEPLKGKTDHDPFVLNFREKIFPILDLFLDPKELLLRVKRCMNQAFSRFLSENHKMTPDSIVETMQEKIQDEEFLKFIRSKVSYLIVDEFQDIDPIQWGVLKKAFFNHANLFLVGDPKQSIYGFRKADLSQYVEARKLFQEEERKTLATNFRATRPIVQGLSRLFSENESNWLFYVPESRESVFSPPLFSASNNDIGCGVFVPFSGTLGRKRKWPHEDIESEFFAWISQEAVHHHEHGIPFYEQALLVKDRYQAERAQEALFKKNIPSSCFRVESVTESEGYRWLLSALKVIKEPKERKNLASLFSFGKDLLFLSSSLVQEEGLSLWADIATQWENVKKAFEDGGIGGLSRALFACKFDGKHMVKEFLYNENPQLVIDIEHLLELLGLLKEAHSLDSCYRALSILDILFHDDYEKLLRRMDPDREGIRIITMHRSKGLEFDVVYALGPSCRTEKEDDAEKIRKLYVSLTRAKKYWYLPLFQELGKKPVKIGEAAPSELFFAAFHSSCKEREITLWQESLYDILNTFDAFQAAENLANENPSLFRVQKEASFCKREEILHMQKQEKRPFLGSLKKESVPIISFSKLQRQKEEELFSPSRGLSSKSFGIEFHRAISLLLLEKEPVVLDSWLEKKGFQKDLKPLLENTLSIKLPLMNTEVLLQDIPKEEMRVESAFLDPYMRGFSSGTLDLLFVHEKHLFVIDWKTHIEEGNISLRDYLKMNSYHEQCRLYRQAACRAYPEFSWGGFFFIFVGHLPKKEAVVLWDEGALV